MTMLVILMVMAYLIYKDVTEGKPEPYGEESRNSNKYRDHYKTSWRRQA